MAVEASDNLALIHVRIMVGNTVVATILPDENPRRSGPGRWLIIELPASLRGSIPKAVAEDSAGNTAEDSFRLRIATDRSSGNPCD